MCPEDAADTHKLSSIKRDIEGSMGKNPQSLYERLSHSNLHGKIHRQVFKFKTGYKIQEADEANGIFHYNLRERNGANLSKDRYNFEILRKHLVMIELDQSYIPVILTCEKLVDHNKKVLKVIKTLRIYDDTTL